MKEHAKENPQVKPTWRKKILEKMFQGLKRPIVTGKNWQILLNKNSKEYSFIMGNSILYVSEEGHIEHSRILSKGNVMTNSNKEPLIQTLNHALTEYAKKHGIETPDEIEDESYSMVIESETLPPKMKTPDSVVKKIRKRLNL